jgi:hypothetical protein
MTNVKSSKVRLHGTVWHIESVLALGGSQTSTRKARGRAGIRDCVDGGDAHMAKRPALFLPTTEVESDSSNMP